MLSGQTLMFAEPTAAESRIAAREDRLVKMITTEADEDGWLRRSRKQLAAALGCSPSTARDAIDRLYASGRIDFDYDYEPIEAGGGITGLMLRLRGARRKGSRRG